MGEIATGLLRFRAYGPLANAGEGGEVSASVFASKLSSLVRALRAADAAMNGSPAHDYTIAKLHTSDPTALLREVRAPKFSGMFAPVSGIDAFTSCVEAVKIGSPRARDYGKCANHIASLARPSKTGMAYAAVWPNSDDDETAIRLDSFLSERAKEASTFIDPVPEKQSVDIAWFKGSVIGSFDGSLDVVDARGAFPQVKLTLSAGHKIIDCVCRAEDIGIIGASLKKRVRITGRAIYDGKQGLPVRVEATEIEPIKEADGFTRWRGSFEAFEISDWGDE